GNCIDGSPRYSHHFVIPASMDDAQVVSLQGDWQRCAEIKDSLLYRAVGQALRNNATLLVEEILSPKPLILRLAMIQQNVEVVVSQDALCPARIYQRADTINDCRTVWTAVR